MAGGDEYLSSGGAIAALLLIGAGTNTYDAFSAVMSSPWSTEKFTSDSQEARMARRYVRHALVITWVYAILGAVLVRQDSKMRRYFLWPLVGAAMASGYMYWLYRQAIERGISPDGMQA